MNRALIALVSAAAAGLAAHGVMAQEVREPHNYFRTRMKLTDSEIRNIDDGKAFAKTVDTGEKSEVVIFGAVYVEAPMESFIEKYRDVESLGQLDNYLGVGTFSTPPKASDVADFGLDEDDLKALKDCKLEDCDIQLPAESMEEFKKRVDWSSPDAAAQANALARERMLLLLDRYQKDGNVALGVYQDKDYALAVDETFETILSRLEGLGQYVPAVRAYLLDYPNAEIPGAEEFFYWERVKFGLKPTIRANHVIITRLTDRPTQPYAVVNKQLYASHYFQVAVDLWFCVKDTEAPDSDGFYLITIKGSRQHGLTGFKGSIVRGVAVPKARGSMETALQTFKTDLEAGAASGGHP